MIQQIGSQAVLEGAYFCRHVQMCFRLGTTTKALLSLWRTILGSDCPGRLGYELAIHMNWWQFYNSGWWDCVVHGLDLNMK